MKIWMFIIMMILRGLFQDGMIDEDVSSQQIQTEAETQKEIVYDRFYACDLVFTKNGDENSMPQELREYIADALRDNQVRERMSAIAAEYEVLDEEGKQEIREEDWGNSLLSYEYFDGTSEDEWYLVELRGNDLVIMHRGEGGDGTYYFEGRYNRPLTCGCRKGSEIFFIQWNGINYMVVYEESLQGVFVHWFQAMDRVTGMRLQEDGQVSYNAQVYNVGYKSGYWTPQY